MTSVKKIAIFASGEGTNAENIIKYFQGNKYVQINLVVSNKTDAAVLIKANKYNIETKVVSKEILNDDIDMFISFLKKRNIDLIVLAGFILLIPQKLITSYSQKIINIHPSLLPKFGGKGMYGMNVHKAVWEKKEKETGITIHHVTEEYDQGEIILQQSVKINSNDTPETISHKVHELEYRHYPKVIESVLSSL